MMVVRGYDRLGTFPIAPLPTCVGRFVPRPSAHGYAVHEARVVRTPQDEIPALRRRSLR